VLASGAKGRGFKSRLAYQKGFPALWGRESFLVYAFLDGI
jgi:cytochrome c